MPFIKLRSLDFYYETHGVGPRLLYISGTGGDLRNTPKPYESALVEHFEMLCYDQRGLGQTDKPDVTYSMADYADDAAALIEATGWAPCHVVGVSFGGMVAQELALRRPDLVRRLVLCCTSTGGAGGSSYPLHELEDLTPEARIRRRMAISDTRQGPEWQAANREEFEELVRSGAATEAKKLADEAGRIGAHRQLEARAGHDTYHRLPSLQLPVLVCGGRYDRQAAPENVEVLHQRIAGSRLAFFEGGHGFIRQDPAAIETIIDFLEQATAGM